MAMFPYNFRMGQKLQTNAKNVKADMGFVAHYQIAAADAVAASNTGVHAGIILADGSGSTLEVNLVSPKTPRALRIKGNAAGIVGNVVITGKNIDDVEITETIAANGATAVEGNKAFKTVTKVVVPQRNAEGDQISFGWNDKLGLPYRLTHNTVIATCHDNTRETVAAAVTVSATDIESNTIDLNAALAGKIVDIYLIV